MTAAEPDSPLALEAIATAAKPTGPRRVGRGLRLFARRSPMSAFWGCIAALIIIVTVAAPELVPYDPLKSDFRAMTKPPTERHVFGTDQIGRDVLSRVIYGGRASLTVAIGAVAFGTTLGALWGLASGFLGGRFDLISQRIIEFLQSFPDLILAMAIAMALGAGFGTVIVAIAITRIPFGGRVILTGDVPSPINPPAGCHFHTRCIYAHARCREEVPALREVTPGHWASCHLHDDGIKFPLAPPTGNQST